MCGLFIIFCLVMLAVLSIISGPIAFIIFIGCGIVYTIYAIYFDPEIKKMEDEWKKGENGAYGDQFREWKRQDSFEKTFKKLDSSKPESSEKI